jgi:hypothetical protein
VLHCIEKQHKKQEKVGHKLESIERMRAGLSNYKMDGQLTKTQSGRNARGAAQTNRFNKQTDYTKYFMSSSDEEAELYAAESGYGAFDGEGENIGLSRRDRRAAKRDQQKWDEKNDAEMDADEDGDAEAESAEEGSEGSEESEEPPSRGRPRKSATRDGPAGGTGRGTRGRRGQVASNQRLLSFGRRAAPSRSGRSRQRIVASDENDLLDRYGYNPQASRSTQVQGSRSQRARRRQLQRGYDHNEDDEGSSDENDQRNSKDKSLEGDDEELRDDQIAEILGDEDEEQFSAEVEEEDGSNSEIEDDVEVISEGQLPPRKRNRQ